MNDKSVKFCVVMKSNDKMHLTIIHIKIVSIVSLYLLIELLLDGYFDSIG